VGSGGQQPAGGRVPVDRAGWPAPRWCRLVQLGWCRLHRLTSIPVVVAGVNRRLLPRLLWCWGCCGPWRAVPGAGAAGAVAAGVAPLRVQRKCTVVQGLFPPGCDLLVGEALLATVTPAGRPAVTRWQLATELVADVGQLEQRIAAVQAHSKTASPRPTPACWSCSGSGVPHGAAASKSRWPVPHPTSHRPIYGWSTRPSISPDPSHRVAASPLHSRSGRWAVHGLGWPSRYWTPPWTGNSVANLIRGGGGHGTPQRGTRPPRL
jgi:hypothetical protein